MVKFAVMTDLHTDIIHDAKNRLKTFVEATNNNHCDFAIQLGDFIQPEFIGTYICNYDRVTPVMKNVLDGKGLQASKKQELFKELSKLNCKLYHALGNHDLDLYTKDEVMKYIGMMKPYYSFDMKNYHFIVLDANYLVDNDKVIGFERGNYMNWCFQKVEPFPLIPRVELDWLKDDLNEAKFPSIIFCHEGLNEGFLNTINHKEIFAILKDAKKGVKICICGHKHEDLFENEEGIPAYFVNSMSGYSVPAKYAYRRFSKETEDEYPNVKYMCVYKDPLFVIVSIDENRINIEGRDTEYIAPSPKDLGIDFNGKVKFSSKTSSIKI